MLQAGAGSTLITNELGSVIQGATVGGVARYVRDELEANALYLADDHTSALLISCDLGGLEPGITATICETIAARTGLPRTSIIVGATHTGGPSVIPTNYLKPVDHAYLERLTERLALLADDCVSRAEAVEVAVSMGEARLGYNRRICLPGGEHAMQSQSAGTRISGLEGPADPQQLAILLRRPDGTLTAILHQNTCHPCSFYGADFYSADFPGHARSILRNAIHENLPVLFFNGAFGDQGQEKHDLPRVNETQERKLIRCGTQLAGETLRLLHEADFHQELPFSTLYRELPATVLLPSPERLADAKALLARVDAGETIKPFDIVRAHGANLVHERFAEAPREMIPVHALRLGPVGIVTQGTELFCQFGLDIKRRSPFPFTAVLSICDGYRGYCPTCSAIVGGGYSADPIYWTRFAPETGYRLVDLASDLLNDLYRQERDHG